MITYVKKCTIMKTYRLDFLKLVYDWCKLVYRLVYGAKVSLFTSTFLVQFCTCRDVRIHHQEVQLFFSFLLMDRAKEHAA